VLDWARVSGRQDVAELVSARARDYCLGDPRGPGLQAAARAHRDAGLRSVTDEHYEGGHWLGTFAVI